MRRGITLVPCLKKGFIRIHKNASTAVKTALKDHYDVRGINLDEAAPHVNYLVAMWRDPMSRLKSAYTFLRRNYDKSLWHQLEGIPDLNSPFSGWAMQITGRLDAHLAPQVEGLETDIPIKIIRWDFDALKREFALPEIPFKNESFDRVNDVSHRTAVFCRQFYRRDYKVWQSTREFL